MEVEDFLEHFGIKGQKWGVRRKSSRGGTKEQKRQGTKKLARNVGIGVASGAAIGVGAAFIARRLGSSGSVPVSSPSTMAFRAAGKGWVVEAQDGRAFDMFFQTLAETGRKL